MRSVDRSGQSETNTKKHYNELGYGVATLQHDLVIVPPYDAQYEWCGKATHYEGPQQVFIRILDLVPVPLILSFDGQVVPNNVIEAGKSNVERRVAKIYEKS